MKILQSLVSVALLASRFSLPALAQTTLSTKGDLEGIQLRGRVVAQDNDKPLSYVNIGLVNKPIGTVSDTTGNFKVLVKEDNINDTLRLSLVGYSSIKIPIKDWIKSASNAGIKTIKLAKSDYSLSEVSVTVNKVSPKIIGRQKDGGFVQFALHPKKEIMLGTEFGMRFELNNHPSLLSDFNFYLSANNFKRIKFRINIYSLKDNTPDSLLFKHELYADVIDYKTGWTKVDLSTYNINIKDDIAISIQWLDHVMTKEENPKVFIPGVISPSHTSYFRIASQDKWTKAKANLCYYITVFQ